MTATAIANGPMSEADHRRRYAGRDREHGRYDHRMVRFFPLRHGDRTGLRQALLSQLRSSRRHAAGVRHLLRRFCGPPDRRGDLRPLRRPHRPQGGADHDLAVDRPCHLCRGLYPDLRPDRHLGRCCSDHHSLHPGLGLGGEWGGSVLLSMEWARSNEHRGFIASWPQFGAPVGFFLANLAVLVFSAISGDQFLSWGWRVPFLVSIVMVGVGLYIRLGILETPTFLRLLAENRIERAPVFEVINVNQSIILVALAKMGEMAPAYVYSVFIFTYGTMVLGSSRDLILSALSSPQRPCHSLRSPSQGICRIASAASACI